LVKRLPVEKRCHIVYLNAVNISSLTNKRLLSTLLLVGNNYTIFNFVYLEIQATKLFICFVQIVTKGSKIWFARERIHEISPVTCLSKFVANIFGCKNKLKE